MVHHGACSRHHCRLVGWALHTPLTHKPCLLLCPSQERPRTKFSKTYTRPVSQATPYYKLPPSTLDPGRAASSSPAAAWRTPLPPPPAGSGGRGGAGRRSSGGYNGSSGNPAMAGDAAWSSPGAATVSGPGAGALVMLHLGRHHVVQAGGAQGAHTLQHWQQMPCGVGPGHRVYAAAHGMHVDQAHRCRNLHSVLLHF
jgi:hypothetical protein